MAKHDWNVGPLTARCPRIRHGRICWETDGNTLGWTGFTHRRSSEISYMLTWQPSRENGIQSNYATTGVISTYNALYEVLYVTDEDNSILRHSEFPVNCCDAYSTSITPSHRLILGALLAFYVQRYVILEKKSGMSARLGPNYSHYNKWFEKQGLSRRAVPWDNIRYSNTTIYKESDYLYSHINIHCLVIVKDTANFAAILDTWAKGCNFINSIKIEPRHKIMPSIQDKDKSSWVLLCKYLGRLDGTTLDWILVVKDTTFVLLENFRQYVAPLNASEPHYLGHAIKFWGIAYNSGNPGYALSKAAILLLQKQIDELKCSENSYRNKEDFYLGKYLMHLNITPVDSADEHGLSTFHPYNWYHMFYPKDNYYVNSIFPVKCCSKSSIAFQATEGSRMYTFDYLFYKLQIFTSGHHGNQPFKSSVSDDEQWKKILRDHDIKSDYISSDAYYRFWENLINDPNSFAANLKKEQFSDYNN